MKEMSVVAQLSSVSLVLSSLLVHQVAFAWGQKEHLDITTEACRRLNKTHASELGDICRTLENRFLAPIKGKAATSLNPDSDCERAKFAELAEEWAKANGKNAPETRHTQREAATTATMEDDHRMLNAIEALKIAMLGENIRLVDTSFATKENGVVVCSQRRSYERLESMEVLANGLHQLQDYFGHLNARGGGTSHGFVPRQEVQFTSVSDIMDLILDGYRDELDRVHWDCHDAQMVVSDVYNADHWHYHEDVLDSWRYVAALDLSMEYLLSYQKGRALAVVVRPQRRPLDRIEVTPELLKATRNLTVEQETVLGDYLEKLQAGVLERSELPMLEGEPVRVDLLANNALALDSQRATHHNLYGCYSSEDHCEADGAYFEVEEEGKIRTQCVLGSSLTDLADVTIGDPVYQEHWCMLIAGKK